MELLLIQMINGLVLGSIYGLIAVGYTMVWRVLKFINFAHGEVYMLGAFAAFALYTAGWPLLLALLGGLLAGGFVGVLMEKIAYRPLRKAPLLNLLIAAIGVSVFLQHAAQIIWGAKSRPLPSPFLAGTIVVLDVPITYHQLFIMLSAVLTMLGLEFFIHRTMLGKAMRATAEDVETAALMGININRVISTTFFLGSFLGSLAGILIGPLYFVHPRMGIMANLKGFTASVLGGMGSIRGALIGGLLLGVTESIGAGLISSGYRDAIAMGVLLVVLLVRPWGLFGHAYLTKHMERV
jgi:branched-chain amino acid transport system permease protein